MKRFRETKIVSFVLTWILVGGALLLSKGNAYAQTIHSNQYLRDNNDTTQAIDRGSDYKNIMYALEQDGTVTLVSGETYNLSKSISLKSGWEINAKGATIYCPGALFKHSLSKTNYGSLKNVTIKGGKWLTTIPEGFRSTSIHFTHAQNIKLLNMTIKTTNYQGHAIELVACKNVTIQNCKILPKGKPGKKSVEEQIQIDIATGTTYPAIAGTEYANGGICKNIKIIKCTVKGNRAVCANFSPKESKYLGKFHSDITIKNCKLTGMTSEALALFNTSSATVTGNTIITNAPLSRESYSVGCHFHLFGNNSASEKGKITVSNNTIKGGRQALYFYSHSSAKYGTAIIKNNK
ncbi:MAG: right-handed parallel beta-helix repeat-containing protein, partial [Lachnospiraceae bacterium]|nr:right-handed parallel beta-helix repeat-containing protein [Lachnospiraceae bacterium]